MKRASCFILAFSLILTCQVKAQSISETRAFGDHLFIEGDYVNALAAYQRVAFFMRPETDPMLLFRLGECFFISGDPDRAVEFYDRAWFMMPDDSMKAECLFRKADCYLVKKQFAYALLELMSDQDYPDGYLYRKGQLLKGIAYYGMEDFQAAGLCFQQSLLPGDTEGRTRIREIFDTPRNFSRPDPRAAMWMSVFLPGLGQARSGAWGPAINSLMLNGLLVAATFYLSLRIHPFDAIITISPWFQRYYQGGLKRASELAEVRRAGNREEIYQDILSIIASGSNPLN